MTRHDVRLALACAAAAVALIAVDALAAGSPLAADLTRSGQYTLTSRSVQVVRRLDDDLTVTGFFGTDQLAARRDVAALLDLYRLESPHVQVRFADPQQEAGLAQSLGATIPGSIALRYRTRPPVVLGPGRLSESDVTGGIARLLSGRTPVVCWASGGGERDLRSTDPVTGYSVAADLLRGSGYRTQELSLDQPVVPAACSVVAVMGPTQPLSRIAQQALQRYRNAGGRLLVADDPWIAGTNAGLVIEPNPAHAAANDATVPVVSRFADSPITRNLDGDVVFFPAATPVGPGPDGSTSVALASTTSDAYVIARQRTDLTPRHFSDSLGPFVLMASFEEGASPRLSRTVEVGTSALAENRAMPPAASSANANLLLASLDWLTGQDDLLAVPPKPPGAVPVSLTEQAARVNVLVALPLPLLIVLFAGIPVLVRRRRTR